MAHRGRKELAKTVQIVLVYERIGADPNLPLRPVTRRTILEVEFCDSID